MNSATKPIAARAVLTSTPDQIDRAERPARSDILISVPSMHCASCMGRIEDGLNKRKDVRSARVNLSLKRVSIDAVPNMSTEDFIPIIQGLGFDAFALDQEVIAASQDATSRGYLLRIGVAGFAMMNVMLLSISVWLGAGETTKDLLHWVSAMIALPAVLYAAQPFFQNAYSALKAGALNMDVPISLAIILALGMSVYETFIGGGDAYFDAAISLTFFLLIGRYLEYRTRSMARSAAQELAALETRKAVRIAQDGDEVVQVSALRIGDYLRILPGARIPVDGVIIEGKSDVDTSFISGETLPSVIGQGEAVRAGMLNLTGMLIVEATAVGEDTSLQQLSRLVAIAESGRNLYTSLADRAARIYAPLVHVLALGAFVAWMLIGGDWHFAVGVAIAVLVITCPCALGLAVPAVNTAASGRLFRAGILLKSETALERLAEVDVAVFDKTGTLTKGDPELVSVEGEHLDVALALARQSLHPLSHALDLALTARGIEPAKIEGAKEHSGRGIEARFRGERVRLGRAEWVGAPSAGAKTQAWLKIGDDLTQFVFRDHLRPNVPETIERFKGAGVRVILLSGDHESMVNALAQRSHIDEYHAEVLPEEKLEFIENLKVQGHKVLMVGDGLNDTAALAEAHVSIAPGQAVEVTRMASDIVLLDDDFDAVYQCFAVAKAAKRRIVENFGMAAGYNFIAVPIALLGFASPFLAALAMSASSICVVTNANRLRWMK